MAASTAPRFHPSRLAQGGRAPQDDGGVFSFTSPSNRRALRFSRPNALRPSCWRSSVIAVQRDLAFGVGDATGRNDHRRRSHAWAYFAAADRGSATLSTIRPISQVDFLLSRSFGCRHHNGSQAGGPAQVRGVRNGSPVSAPPRLDQPPRRDVLQTGSSPASGNTPTLTFGAGRRSAFSALFRRHPAPCRSMHNNPHCRPAMQTPLNARDSPVFVEFSFARPAAKDRHSQPFGLAKIEGGKAAPVLTRWSAAGAECLGRRCRSARFHAHVRVVMARCDRAV